MKDVTQAEIYSISTDILCNYYEANHDHSLSKIIAEFLQSKSKDLETSILYEGFIQRQDERVREILLSQLPPRNTWEQERKTSGALARKMVEHMGEFPDIIKDPDDPHNPFNWNTYYFFGSDFQVPNYGVILNQKVEVELVRDKAYFLAFFSFIFQKVPNQENFLQFHFIETFKRDQKKYKRFLLECLDLIIFRKDYLRQWIEDELSINPHTNDNSSNEEFKKLFSKPELYDYVIAKLSTTEGGKWFDSTGNFIRTGNNNARAAITLLDLLITRHYFKPIDWNNQLKSEAILKCWGVPISPTSSTIRNHFPEFFDILSPILKNQIP